MGIRGWLVAATLLSGINAQPAAVLRITVTIVDADGAVIPVPRHALVVSDNPASAPPRRTVTALDGTAEVHLRPGNYTVESDQPLIVQGKAYLWRQTLDVAAGTVSPLRLGADNAEIEAVASGLAVNPEGGGGNPSALLIDWQKSVFSIWSPTALGAGFLIDARGLVATNQRLAGTATSLEVQLSPTEKIAARVLAADGAANVAILWIDPASVASARPVTLADAGATPPADDDTVFAITTPIDGMKGLTSGVVSRVSPGTLVSDIRLDDNSLGAPLFNAAGLVVALTTPEADISSSASHAVRIEALRRVIASAEVAMLKVERPGSGRLPVEPRRAFPADALKEAARVRGGSLSPYTVPAADFDVSLITPVLLYGARHRSDELRGQGRGRAREETGQGPLRALENFGNWAEYVEADPAVLMIRATPKLVENIWTTIARGAASTQGVSIPPIKRIKAGFSRMRVTCGDAEIAPIHPFRIEQRLDETTAVYEGLYVFDPAAIGPHCGTVTLTLFSDKDPAKGDTRVVDPKILQQIAQDFAPWRALP